MLNENVQKIILLNLMRTFLVKIMLQHYNCPNHPDYGTILHNYSTKKLLNMASIEILLSQVSIIGPS